eukprot:Gb_27598 [translate_table: standard]
MGRKCLCAPPTHPGSFKCSLHRTPRPAKPCGGSIPTASKHSLVQLQKQCQSGSAMANFQARSAVLQREIARRALFLSIRPTCNLIHRRDFERRPSRLSKVSMATDADAQRVC